MDGRENQHARDVVLKDALNGSHDMVDAVPLLLAAAVNDHLKRLALIGNGLGHGSRVLRLSAGNLPV